MNSSLNSIGYINGDGAGGICLAGNSCDFAEWLPRLRKEEAIEAGDIVGIVAGMVTRDTASADQLQVVSTAPIISGNLPGEEETHLYEQVAFLGQAPVKVRGKVGAGDYIVSSGLNDGTGVAVSAGKMTSECCGQIVGRAMESSDESGLKLVRAMVGVHSSGLALRDMMLRKDKEISQLTERLEALEQMVKESKE